MALVRLVRPSPTMGSVTPFLDVAPCTEVGGHFDLTTWGRSAAPTQTCSLAHRPVRRQSHSMLRSAPASSWTLVISTEGFVYMMTMHSARPRWISGFPLVLATLLVGCLGESADTLKISAPTLFPAFSSAHSDYVVRCDTDEVLIENVRVSALAIKAGTVQSDTVVSHRVKLIENKAVEVQTPDQRYSVRCLPKGFPVISVTGHAPLTEGEPEMFSADFPLGGSQQRAVVFDAAGTPIWWRAFGSDPRALKVLPDGSFTAMNTSPNCQPSPGNFSYCSAIYTYSPKTGVASSVLSTTLALDVHDIQRTPSGSYLGIRYVFRDCALPGSSCQLAPDGPLAPDSRIADAEIIEFDVASGAILFRWTSVTEALERFFEPRWTSYSAFADLGLAPFRFGDERVVYPDGTVAHDIFHVNSVDQRGDKLLVSFRHLDALMQISKTTGLVEWKLGGKHWEGRSLPILGNPAFPAVDADRLLGGQHDARYLADTSELSVYDNGSGLGRDGRSLKLQINPGTGARVVELLGTNPGIKSVCCGSARRTTASWVVSWGGANTVGVYGVSGQRLLEMSVDLATASGAIGFSYQFVPVPAGYITKSDLRADMNRN
jgi:hypothetical protein